MRKPRLIRQAGWDAALIDALTLHQQQPFGWGVSDCIVLVADVARAMTGVDPMADWRGTYDTAEGATATLAKLHHRTVSGLLGATFQRVAPALARRGDCGVVETLEGGRRVYGAVIVLGDMLAGKSPTHGGETGMTILPRDRLVRCWRIG
jgi:hypothetical protein